MLAGFLCDHMLGPEEKTVGKAITKHFSIAVCSTKGALSRNASQGVLLSGHLTLNASVTLS